mgnify:FL=1
MDTANYSVQSKARIKFSLLAIDEGQKKQQWVCTPISLIKHAPTSRYFHYICSTLERGEVIGLYTVML